MLDALTSRSVLLDHKEPDRDVALVARVKRDRRAFAALYDRYLDPIYRYCYRRLGIREAAEDATSLIFTKAIDAIDGCRDGAFRSWLFAIAHNVVADTYRSARPVETLDAAAHLCDPSPSPDELAIRDEEERQVLTLLLCLSPEQRDVVELRLAGLTGPEIAAALGKRPNAVRIAQFRAYSRLRMLIGEATEESNHGN